MKGFFHGFPISRFPNTLESNYPISGFQHFLPPARRRDEEKTLFRLAGSTFSKHPEIQFLPYTGKMVTQAPFQQRINGLPHSRDH